MRDGIIFTGANEFPFGSAVVQRQIQLANILKSANYEIFVINRRGAHSEKVVKREGIRNKGSFNGIKYYFGSFSPFKSRNFIVRNLFKIIGFFGEFFYIFYCKYFKNAVFIFNNSININELKYYFFLSQLFNLQLVYDYVEYVSSMYTRDNNLLSNDFNNFDLVFYKYTDKIIVISTFLEKHLRDVTSEVQMIKIPPGVDFSLFNKVEIDKEETPFFLFCCSVAYMDLIKFVLDSFELFSIRNSGLRLKLILNGSEMELLDVDNMIKEKKLSNKVDILSKIPYSELIRLNKAAISLLIPFGNSIQDKARFPFKICEYVASKSPIITTNVPLINEIFEDGYSAYLSQMNNSLDFSNKMLEVAENPSDSIEIGNRAYELGLKIFDYRAYTKSIQVFLQH